MKQRPLQALTSSRAGRHAHRTVEENAAIMKMHFRRKTTVERIETLIGGIQNICKCTNDEDKFIKVFWSLTKAMRFVCVAARNACRFLEEHSR
jgi:hypothetical protein